MLQMVGGWGVTLDDAFGFARVSSASRMSTWPHSVRLLSAARSFCSTETITPERYFAAKISLFSATCSIDLDRSITRVRCKEHNKQSKKCISALTFVDLRSNPYQSWKHMHTKFAGNIVVCELGLTCLVCKLGLTCLVCELGLSA